MNVGIISNQDHAKSHKKALLSKGHSVTMLGGNPRAVPPTIELLVCRPASCSHGGFNKAMDAKRNGRDVVITNGVTEMLNAVKSLSNGETPAPATAPKQLLNAAHALEVLPRLLGVYSAALHAPEAGPVVELLASRNGTLGAQGLALWKKGLKAVQRSNVRRYAQLKMDKRAAEEQVWVYTYPSRGGSRRLAVFVEDPEALSLMMDRMDLAQTKEEAEKRRISSRKAIPPAPPKKGRAAKKAAAKRAAVKKTVAKKPLPAPASVPVLPSLASLVAQPVPEPPPAVVEELASATVVEEAKPAAWDDSLRSAIAMLLTEMKAARVTRLVIGSDGSVHFEREVLVVQVEDGSMTVAAD